MEAVVGGNAPAVLDSQCGIFTSNTPRSRTMRGMEALSGKHSARRAASGSWRRLATRARRSSSWEPTDVPRINAIGEVGIDMLRKIGMNVDVVATDWGTTVQRITRKQPIADGGWSIFGVMWGGYDWYSPAGDASLRGNGLNAWFGWPDAPKLEALREQWLRAPDVATQKALARDIQLQAFEDVPCMPLGL